jgi:hypothetical protein
LPRRRHRRGIGAGFGALASMMLLASCQRSQRAAGAGCPPPEGAPSFQERAPERLSGGAVRTSDGALLIYLRHGIQGGAPLEGANVALHRGDAVGSGVGLIDLVETDVIGLAMIDSVRPRDYRIDIRRIGYFPVSGRVNVRPGHVHIIDAALVRNTCGTPSRTERGRVARFLPGTPA